MPAPDGGAETEAVLLVVSEPVTNAVRHAGGVTGFGLRAGPDTVTATVEDASRLPPDAARPGGIGRRLVQDLAQDVAVTVGPSGKAESAVLPLGH
ncbi:ATP-binding protein [Streptomyces coeruleorubidus]|uniref:ATP-binding protein n=1 Tax=Streptomyces coeruleorubidus TaxID=116188 RepID=UPI00237F21DF|nr:ATP-binding protein [Streptomyces coeruleorubidus]WDV49494.1 ATP-binding protein [Streptomyces coeruleorubidus]